MRLHKKDIIVSIITGIITLIIQVFLFNIKKEPGWWSNNVDGIKYFLPAWTIIYMFVGYYASMKYHNEKSIFFPKEKTVSDDEKHKRLKKWKKHRAYLISNLFTTLSKVGAFIVSGLLLAYFDNSKIVKSNIPLIIASLLLTATLYVSSKLLKKKYNI